MSRADPSRADEAQRPSQAEAFARIRLLRSPNIGPVSYRQLTARFGSAEAAIAALPELAARGGRHYKAAPEASIEAEIRAARAAGASYLFDDMPAYPALLRMEEGHPPILTWRGDISLLAQPMVAMVGARNASAGALALAQQLAGELSQAGFVVVSGLARGIDGAAHQAALPRTVGVIASGIDIAYPPEHSALHDEIAERGLLLAESPPGTVPRAQNFPSRNRIIAGLAMGTVVVEAAPRSGSLITARLAGEAGREVMAVPGSPLDSRSQGCNNLIREGAVLVQCAADIIELLSAFDSEAGAPLRDHPDETDNGWSVGAPMGADLEADNMMTGDEIAAILSQAPISVDTLIRQTGESPGSVQLALLELEIVGRLVRHAGGRVSLAPHSESMTG